MNYWHKKKKYKLKAYIFNKIVEEISTILGKKCWPSSGSFLEQTDKTQKETLYDIL
jgi:hypothetical protein